MARHTLKIMHYLQILHTSGFSIADFKPINAGWLAL